MSTEENGVKYFLRSYSYAAGISRDIFDYYARENQKIWKHNWLIVVFYRIAIAILPLHIDNVCFGPIVVSCIRRTALAFIDVNHPNGNVVKAPRVL